jgi:cell wall-associated NlpC family hydrolase
VLTGVDCSGLVNWSFRQVGWLIPRDAHEQFLKCRPITSDELKPADLVFTAKADQPQKIVHVSFYIGQGRLLEAPQSGERVREISFLDRFGLSLNQVKSGMTIGNRVVYFGSFFTEGK